MNNIRQILIDRQLSFNQASAMIGQRYIADIFSESDTSTIEDDAEEPMQDDFLKPAAGVP
jgi:hypothetical protein